MRAEADPEFLEDCRRYWAKERARVDAATLAAARRLLRAGKARGVRVADAGAAGKGLFAARAFRRGELIGEYAGRLTDAWRPLSSGGALKPFLLKYPFPTRYAIDAADHGNELRFANHSARHPNAARVHVLWRGVIRVLFAADSAIPAGAQILIDYGRDYWTGREPLELRP